MTGANAKIKRIYVGDKQVRPPVYEYSYDFRGKTKTQVTADGWQAGTGDAGTGCGTDGLYATVNPGRLIRQFDINMSNAKKNNYDLSDKKMK